MLGRWFRKLLPDKTVQLYYVAAGRDFGDAVSYLYMGECVGFEGLLDEWELWEAEYARRGFVTLPIDDFIAHGGYGSPLTGIGTKRPAGVELVLHARIYREKFLGKVKPVLDWEAMMDPKATEDPGVQAGEYRLPTTKSEGDKQGEAKTS